MRTSFVCTLVWMLTLAAGQWAGAEEWAPFEGADQLRDLVAGATAEIELGPGKVVRGEYRADGTATITAWGETFERTWEVQGDDRVCYSSDEETNCYTFERNVEAPGEYRARHVETGEIRVFRVMQADPEVIATDSCAGWERESRFTVRRGSRRGVGRPQYLDGHDEHTHRLRGVRW